MTTILQTYIKVKGFYRILIFFDYQSKFHGIQYSPDRIVLRSFLIKAEDLPDKGEAFVRWLELNSVTDQNV